MCARIRLYLSQFTLVALAPRASSRSANAWCDTCAETYSSATVLSGRANDKLIDDIINQKASVEQRVPNLLIAIFSAMNSHRL